MANEIIVGNAPPKKMITRIELTNFMSHKHTVIEPAAGLTVLVGPNNIGKSRSLPHYRSFVTTKTLPTSNDTASVNAPFGSKPMMAT